MKRDPIENKQIRFNSFYKIFIWEKCHCCKLEFRREWGWKWLNISYIPFYLCMSCAKTEKEASEYFLNLATEDDD